MFNESEIKSKIQLLVEKYEAAKSAGQIRRYTEEDTKKDFILPLFNCLGWDTDDRNEVSSEESIKSSGRVDYGFYINGRPKFYLEAKPLRAEIHKEEYANQAIKYSWNKGVTWAVLTDFESIIVFNTQDIKQSLAGKRLFEIPYSQFLERFDQLSLLTRKSFESDLIDKEAERVGKKFQKVPVNELLFEDLNECREILTKSLSACNDEMDKDLLDEGVQKLLDRLIFLRVAEDRGIEPPTLIPLLRQYEARKDRGEISLYKSMVEKFRELDKIYNSNLFSEHPFENWEEYSGATDKVINILYGKRGYYEYDFKIIPADVLGTVYENYLGYKLSQSKKATLFKNEDIKILKDSRKRKEQGIYYTPVFIVDYIVKNALKPVLDKCESIDDLKKVKVLDPACGSGSFLIKAFELIYEKYREFGYRGQPFFVKTQILTQNIYGVDLDAQAVELARLNLLINSLDSQFKLPLLNNIKQGNSLISGTDEKLEKKFGKNWRDKKPFNWHEEFPEVFKQGGFDVVIGNPPYIKEFVNKDAFNGLHDSPYYQGKMDIWTMFACISIDLLKDGGIMSFIAPNNWVSNAGASIFRNKILKEGELKNFIDFGDYKVFEQAGIQTMIYVFEKKKPSKRYNVEYLRVSDKNIQEAQLIADIFSKKQKIGIEPEKLIDKNITFSTSEYDAILNKLESKRNFKLTDDEISNGIHHHHDRVNKKRREVLGKDFKVGDGIFVLNDSEKNKIPFTKEELAIIKPSYTTKELSRWYGNYKNKEWVIYTDSSFKDSDKINSYPNIKKHLDKFREVITSYNGPYGLHRAKKEKFFKGEKIIALRKCTQPTFTYTDFDSYVSATFYIIKSSRINQKYLTSILNSKIIAFWLRNKGKMQGNNYQLDKEPLVNIPIYIGSAQEQSRLIFLVDKIISLYKEFHKEVEHSEKWESLKSEIEKTDKKIDEEVYKLYDLTPEEIKVVESR